MKKLLLLMLSAVLFVAGMITFPLPIPTGILLMLTGLALLVSTSTSAANWVKQYRIDYPDVNKGIISIEKYFPEMIRETLRKTNPNEETPE